MKSIVITLPFPPAMNKPSSSGMKWRYPSKAYRLWRREADLRIMAAQCEQIAGPVAINMTLHARVQHQPGRDEAVNGLIECFVRMGVIQADDQRAVATTYGEWRIPPVAVITITPADPTPRPADP